MNNIVRITESMKKEPTPKFSFKKRVGHLELSITKYKLWHHRHADWQLDIHNLKTGECLLGSSHSESYARAEDAAKNLKKIRSYSQIEKLIEDDGLLFEKTAYYKQSK